MENPKPRDFWKNEEGQTMVEYALLLVLLVPFIGGLDLVLLRGLNSFYEQVLYMFALPFA